MGHIHNVRYIGLLFAFLSLPHVSLQAHTYMVQLALPNNDIAQEVGLLYKGYTLDTTTPSCIRLPEAQPVAAFCLVCSDEVHYERDDVGDIESISRVSHRPMRWFDITYTGLYQQHKHNWEVVERNQYELPSRLPSNTIFVLTDPDALADVNAYTVISSQGHYITYIVLTCKEEKQETRNSLRAMMASLDAKSFHTPVRKTQEHTERRTITMHHDLP